MEKIDPAQVFYFSEGGEDFLLWSLFRYKRRGAYIDIGAFDGRYLSNSLSFARSGWRGVCVEPVAEYYELCKTNQPDAVCIRAACVDDPALENVQFHAEPLGVYSRLELAPNAETKLKHSYEAYSANLPGFENINVPAVTVSQLIDEHLEGQAPDFLSVDVEGSEITVLEGVDFDRHHPRIIVAEANDNRQAKALTQWLLKQGYELIRNVNNNYFYSCETELVQRGRRIPIKCVIERHMHPKGLQFTFRGIAMGKVIDETHQEEFSRLRWAVRKQKNLLGQIDALEERCAKMTRAMVRDRKSLEEASQKLTRRERVDIKLCGRIENLDSLLQTCKDRRIKLEKALEQDRGSLRETSRELASCRSKIAEIEDFLARHFHVPRPRPFRRKETKS